MDEDPLVTFAEAIALHQQYAVTGSAEATHLLRMSAGELATARAAMNGVLASEHSGWWDVQNIQLTLQETGAENLSTAQLSTLEALASTEGEGSAAARAWLGAINGERSVVDVILPGSGTRAFIGGRIAAERLEQNWLSIYPNPTKGEAYVTYQLPEGVEKGTIEVHDPTGRLLLTKSLQGGSGIVELPRAQLGVGAYVVSLKADGLRVSTSKFIVQR